MYPSKPENCEVAIFEKPARPNANVEVLAKIESHIKRNFFLGGKVSVKEDAYKELRLRACQLGGDSLIIEDSVESAAAEMTHVHVWATVLRTSR